MVKSDCLELNQFFSFPKRAPETVRSSACILIHHYFAILKLFNNFTFYIKKQIIVAIATAFAVQILLAFFFFDTNKVLIV